MNTLTDKQKNRILFFKDLFESNQLPSKTGAEVLMLSSKFIKIEDSFRKEVKKDFMHKKIFFMSSYTTYPLAMILKLHLYSQGVIPEFYEGSYGNMVFELMDKESKFYSFNPDILLLMTDHNDIKDYPPLFAKEEVNLWVEEKLHHYQQLWNMASSLKTCQLMQSLFVSPPHRQLGNLEANYSFSRTNCLRKLNLALIENRPSNVTFIDMEHHAYTLGKSNWFDETNYFLSKQGYSFDAANKVAYALSRTIATAAGKIKKCLVLDLDNTLWGGVIGDDGLEGINLNPNDPLGEAFLAFQKYIKGLKARGVILAVCSKNEESAARQPFQEHSDMFLKLDDISCFIANWNDKASNLIQIAKRLNIGLDSLVFFDDNPAERDIVKKFTPEVEVIDVPEDPALYIRALEEAMCFEWPQLSAEDINRSESYVLDSKRNEMKTMCVDYDSYLQSLEMKAQVGQVSPLEAPRFSQLINKSNQFNLRTQRYNEAYIDQLMVKNSEWALLYISLEDKFGNYGIISCLVIEKKLDKAFIDTWVMSCRVLNRGVEDIAFNLVCETAQKWNCSWIVGEFLPTKKNKLVLGLYEKLGFENCPRDFCTNTAPEGTLYRIEPAEICKKTHFVEILEDS
jgi:FkbH-like protein